MPENHAQPGIVFPEDLRRHSYDSRRMFVQNLRLFWPLYRLIVILFAVYIFILSVATHGWSALLEAREVSISLSVIAGLAVLTGGLWVVVQRRLLRNDKFMYLEHAIGFDAEALYVRTELTASRMAWETFSRWIELPDAFVLRTARGGSIIPKEIWTEEEQEQIRGYLREKVKPCRAWLQGRSQGEN